MNTKKMALVIAGALLVASCAAREKAEPSQATGTESLRSDSEVTAADESERNEVEEEKRELQKTVSVSTLVEGNNRFALDMLKHAGSGNVAYSPYGVTLAGLMLRAGADGATAEQLDATFRVQLQEGTLDSKVKTLREHISRGAERGFDPGVVRHVWMDEAVTLQSAFSRRALDGYSSTVELASFESEQEARGTIDEAMAAATSSVITGVTGEYPLGSRKFAVTVGATPRGAWAVPFERGRTTEAIFTNLDGSKGNRAVMRGSGRFRYAEDGTTKIVELPFEGNATAIIVLPRQGTFETVEASLSYDKLKFYMGRLRSSDVQVTLPKVKIRTSLDMVPILTSMGAGTAFADRAEFNGAMGADSAPIDLFAHETVFELDEDGARAQSRSVRSANDVKGGAQFEATRPFLVFVRDNSTGQILLVARVV